jgi:hypothetical protein
MMDFDHAADEMARNGGLSPSNLREFAAKVLREEVTGFRQAYSTEFFSEVTIADYGKMPAETFVSCWSASMGRHIVECIERRAKEIEGGE